MKTPPSTRFRRATLTLGLALLACSAGGPGADDGPDDAQAASPGRQQPSNMTQTQAATTADGESAAPTAPASPSESSTTVNAPAANSSTPQPVTSGATGGDSAAAGAVASADGPFSDDAATPPANDATTDTADAAPPTATLPPADDPASAGPFTVERVDRVSDLSTHSLFIPSDVGLNGKHPVVIWTNGNGGSLGTLAYASFLEHVASHGFLVIGDKASNGSREAEVDSQKAAIDWALAQNSDASSMFFERIDDQRIAVMGHSLGSLASFATASDERIRTSIHFSGGITDNPVGFDPAWLQQMRQPAAFLCGGADNTAGPSCKKDFEMAPVPVFYGVLSRASHIGPFTSQRGGEYGRVGVAWLRWQLADDESYRKFFVGNDCVLCAAPWSAQQRDLE